MIAKAVEARIERRKKNSRSQCVNVAEQLMSMDKHRMGERETTKHNKKKNIFIFIVLLMSRNAVILT